MKFFTSFFLGIFLMTMYGHVAEIKYKEPICNTGKLDSFINMNKKPYLKDSIIVIYTYLSCKPCQVLAQKIQKKFNKSEFWQRIVFVNDIDIVSDTMNVQRYLELKEFPFPYLISTIPEMNGTYPLICFYSQKGILINKVEGFSSINLARITNFLER